MSKEKPWVQSFNWFARGSKGRRYIFGDKIMIVCKWIWHQSKYLILFFFCCSSGRSSLTSTALNPLVITTEPQISSWNALKFTTTRLQAASMSHAQSSSIWSQAPWTLCAPAHTEPSSVQTTLFSARAAPATTGPRDTTLKELSLSIPSLTWSGKRPSHATACRDSKWLTPWVAVPVPAWEHSSSPRSVRNIQTESWTPTLSYHHQRFLTPSSSLTTQPFPFTSLLRTPMRPTVLTTRLSTTFASEPWSSPTQPTVISTIWCPWPCRVSLLASGSQVL